MCAVYLVLRQREHPDMRAVIHMKVEHSRYSLTSYYPSSVVSQIFPSCLCQVRLFSFGKLVSVCYSDSGGSVLWSGGSFLIV